MENSSQLTWRARLNNEKPSHQFRFVGQQIWIHLAARKANHDILSYLFNPSIEPFFPCEERCGCKADHRDWSLAVIPSIPKQMLNFDFYLRHVFRCRHQCECAEIMKPWLIFTAFNIGLHARNPRPKARKTLSEKKKEMTWMISILLQQRRRSREHFN